VPGLAGAEFLTPVISTRRNPDIVDDEPHYTLEGDSTRWYVAGKPTPDVHVRVGEAGGGMPMPENLLREALVGQGVVVASRAASVLLQLMVVIRL